MSDQLIAELVDDCLWQVGDPRREAETLRRWRCLPEIHRREVLTQVRLHRQLVAQRDISVRSATIGDELRRCLTGGSSQRPSGRRRVTGRRRRSRANASLAFPVWGAGLAAAAALLLAVMAIASTSRSGTSHPELAQPAPVVHAHREAAAPAREPARIVPAIVAEPPAMAEPVITASDGIGRVVRVDLDAQLERDGAYRALAVDDVVHANDRLHGSVTVRLWEHIVVATLGGDCRIDATEPVLHLHSGRVSVATGGHCVGDAHLAVQTEHQRFTSLGTTFRVRTQADGDLLAVSEGRVHCSRDDVVLSAGEERFFAVAKPPRLTVELIDIASQTVVETLKVDTLSQITRTQFRKGFTLRAVPAEAVEKGIFPWTDADGQRHEQVEHGISAPIYSIGTDANRRMRPWLVKSGRYSVHIRAFAGDGAELIEWVGQVEIR